MSQGSELDKIRVAVQSFHELYYQAGDRGGTWKNTFWMGVPIAKCPLDLWIYQEILFEVRPAAIVECGTFRGGSALYLAHLCDLLGHGRVLTIDVANLAHVYHPRLTRLIGSSVDASIMRQVREWATAQAPVLVILDSDHKAEHVLQELRMYGPLVTPGSYLIVEDTNINGHPVRADFGAGPMEAVQAYLAEEGSFAVDPSREKLFITFNPNGYLRKKPSGDL